MEEMSSGSSDEEMAYKLVELYVREVSQRGEKRQMGLDTIINAYFYSLLRLKKKKGEMQIIEPAVMAEEEKLEDEVEHVKFPQASGSDEDIDQFGFD